MSIYAFRAATVRNILDFPDQFSPQAAVISLEHNYRSTQPILDAANAVIAQAREGFSKTLTSSKPSAELPHLITVEDEEAIAPRSRFLPDDILPLFTRRAAVTPEAVADTPVPQPVARVDIGARLRGMWA